MHCFIQGHIERFHANDAVHGGDTPRGVFTSYK